MWMTRDLVTVAPEDDVAAAAAVMSEHHVRRVLVTTPGALGMRLVGIASARDLARAFPPDVNPFSATVLGRRIGHTVAEVMSTRLETVTPETPIEDAARRLRDRKIGALPVLRAHVPVGIVTESDIFQAFLEIIGTGDDGHSVRITFDVSAGEDAVRLSADLARQHGLYVASVLTMVHEGHRLAVVRVSGRATKPFVDAIWRSGHRVVSVLEPH
jgi:acetoin utilization protein AcuB